MDTSKVKGLAATVRDFLLGETDIFTFRSLYDTNPEINDFLQAVIDYYIVNNVPFLGCPHRIYNGSTDRVYYSEDVYYFKNPKAYPGAINGKRALYIGSKKNDGGEFKEYYFRDETNGEIITVKQFY